MTAISDPSTLKREFQYRCQIGARDYTFHTTWGLFSPKALDEGSALILEYMPVEQDDICLDLGCGYGPMGLAMAAQASRGKSILIDKDFVAIDYSRRNAQINRLENTEIYLSNGFSHVPEEANLSLVASNLPAKAGKELYYLYFFDAKARMQKGGRFYIVTITGLRRFVERAFKEVFGNYKKVKQGQTYTVAMAVCE